MNFETAVEFVIKHEGGYVWDNLDPGGETKYGISKRAYPNVNIKALTRDDAINIYKRDYWDKLPDGLPTSIHCALFDCAVNTGISRAIRLLQSAVKVNPDGQWGRLSQSALNKRDANEVLLMFTTERIMFYSALSTFARFGKGWVSRSVSCLAKFKE